MIKAYNYIVIEDTCVKENNLHVRWKKIHVLHEIKWCTNSTNNIKNGDMQKSLCLGRKQVLIIGLARILNPEEQIV